MTSDAANALSPRLRREIAFLMEHHTPNPHTQPR